MLLFFKYLHVNAHKTPMIIINEQPYLYVLLQTCNLFGSQVNSIQ